MNQIVQWPSCNFDGRGEGISPRFLMFHFTNMDTTQEALDRLVDPQAAVSSHYLVDEKGACFRLVDEKHRAWHAGLGRWRDIEKNLNAHSIGIEISAKGHHPFPPEQIAAVKALSQNIVTRWSICPHDIIGHSDWAPGRKDDPGVYFPWKDFSRVGLGIWPDDQPHSGLPMDPMVLLKKIGYDPDVPEEQLMVAFCLHWHPEALKHGMNDETWRRLERVAMSYDAFFNS